MNRFTHDAHNARNVTPTEFVAKWRPVEFKERSAAQTNFNDPCRVLYSDLAGRGVGDVGVDLTKAVSLRENREVASNGISKKGHLTSRDAKPCQ